MRILKHAAACGALAATLVTAGAVQAVDVDVQVAPKKGVAVQVNRDKAKGDEGKPVQKAGENVEVETVYRASQITGMPVMNREREDLGKINDLVLDLQAGEVRYAALSFGGVLGLGDKLFAIPWDALKLRSEADKNFFVLEVDPERLKTAPGFDQENWPNTADPKWHMDIRKHFTSTNATTEKTTVKKTKPIEEGTPDYSAVMRISKVSGMKVKNPDQEELGTIDELVININGGKVRYAVLSFGGVLGVGDKLFAIPWDALQFKQNDEESFFVLSVSKERLKTAPGFNKSEWPDTATPEWRQEIDAYYQAKTTKK
jgi:sporulation protein YlmC with PRC-barrel domain